MLLVIFLVFLALEVHLEAAFFLQTDGIPLLSETTKTIGCAVTGVYETVESVAKVPLQRKFFDAVEKSKEWIEGSSLSLSVKEVSDDEAVESTIFYLYTRKTCQNYNVIVLGNLNSIKRSAFDVNKSTKIFIHGWVDNARIDSESPVRDAYLSRNESCNVVIVDWSKLSGNLLYPVAKNSVVPVGKACARFVDWLVGEVRVRLDSIHVIGHSLGAHVAGVIGEHVTAGKVTRITGLDPAGPLFGGDTSGRLDRSDAQFVDVIHTCGGILGYFKSSGHVDFFPNEGVNNQPGCEPDVSGICAHLLAVDYFAESVSSTNFVSTICDTWEHFIIGKCNKNDVTVMGEHVDTSARGNFYLTTGDSYPYALGRELCGKVCDLLLDVTKVGFFGNML